MAAGAQPVRTAVGFAFTGDLLSHLSEIKGEVASQHVAIELQTKKLTP